MRVMVFHNFYRSSRPSGENNAVLADVRAMRDAGHEVLLAGRSSDEVADGGPAAKLRAAASTVYSREGRDAALAAARSFRPDVAHLHNLTPLWSPSVADALVEIGVPRLQVLHNYRLSCLNGSHMLNGVACFRCLGRRQALPGVAHRCYNDSLGGSAVVALSRTVNARRAMSADRYLAVSSTVRERAVQHGLPPESISVKPEFLSIDRPAPSRAGNDLLFVGRLDVNKGCLLLLDAFADYRASGGRQELRVAGSGPLEAEMRRRAARIEGVHLLGQLTPAEAREAIASCRAVVSPALWAEPFGLTVLEAWREGRPVIVTDLGGPAEMVSAATGWVVPSRVAPLAGAMAEAEDAGDAHARGVAGRAVLAERFSSSAVLAAYRAAWDRIIGA